MGKRSRHKARSAETSAGEVGPRQPCPCGSGRRYKACHGSAAGAPPFHSRPFEGLRGECDVVALREFVPAATATMTLAGAASAADPARQVLVASLLPGAAPALVRADGAIWLGLQVRHAYGDPSRDLAAVLEKALVAEPQTMVGLTEPPGDGPRLQDLVTDAPLEVTVHEGFDYWLAGLEDPDGSMAAALEQANAAVAPTRRLASVEAAYWTEIGNREYLRWVLPEGEDPLLDALARLHHAGEDRLVEGARLLGMFRAHGLLVPVWDVPVGTGGEALEQPAADFGRRLQEVLADPAPLSTEERSARAGLANRQLTVR
ncbi:MAG TPA: DUF5926 family protein [Marmoricola sp.]|nr:DUF5926 family protein [Marmoricola sp.]